jgi:hypothetical protein
MPAPRAIVRGLFLATAASAVFPSALLAQAPPLEPPPQVVNPQVRVRTTPGTAPADIDTRTFTLEFPGGSVADYAEAIRKTEGGDMNIVYDPTAASVELPNVNLRNVTVATAFRLLETLQEGKEPRLSVQEVRDGSGGETVYVIRLSTGKGWAAPNMPKGPMPTVRWQAGAGNNPFEAQVYGLAQSPKRVQVFSLKKLVSRPDSDPTEEAKAQAEFAKRALTAVEAVLEIDTDRPGGRAPTFKYHEESGLLIVRGTNEEIDQVSQVLDALSESPIESLGGNASGQKDLAAAVARLTDEIAKLHAEVDALKAALGKKKDPEGAKR